jgi:copper(I)-binding protein
MRRLLIASLVLLPAAAFAQNAGITVDHVWSRAAAAGRTGAVYLTVTDTGAPDRLTGVSSPVANKVELHETQNVNGVMQMRPVDALPVAPGKPVTLAPGGYHIMMIGLKQPLKEGDTFPVTLTFEHAGPVTATATVARAGATSAAMPMDHDMSHMNMTK